MRTLLVLVGLPVVLASTALVACGGDDSVAIAGNDASTSGGDSAGGDHDGGAGSDSGTSSDGSTTGDSASGGDSSTADTGTTQACTSPAGCGSATPVCCGTIMVTGGMVPNCTTNPPVVECKTGAACPTTLGTTCSGTQVVRLCSASADCTEPSNNKCCAFTRDGGVLSFCSSALIAGIAGGTCQ